LWVGGLWGWGGGGGVRVEHPTVDWVDLVNVKSVDDAHDSNFFL